MGRIGSQRAYSRYRHVTHHAVQRAIAAGRITTLPSGQIDFETADREWAEKTTWQMRPAGPGSSPELQKVRLAGLSYRVATMRLMLERERAKLVDAELVRQEATAMYRKVRARLLKIPDALADRLADVK